MKNSEPKKIADLISIVAPVYNEEKSIAIFVERLVKVLEGLNQKYQYEIILVDDGSRDDSLSIMRSMIDTYPNLKVLELRRNYGQTAALQAGIDSTSGDIIITMDSDLQHFPEDIPAFLEKLEQGYDIICGWRAQRAEGRIRRWPSRVANLLIKGITGIDIHDFGTTFRAYRTELIKEIRLLGEFHRFIPALGGQLGGRIVEIPIQNIERPAGVSSYGLGRTLGVLLDLIFLWFMVRYMDRPMRAFGKAGILTFGLGSSIMLVLVCYSYLYNVHAMSDHVGWALVAVMLIIASLQMIISGIVAEILVRIHYEQGDRRVYRVRRVWGEDITTNCDNG